MNNNKFFNPIFYVTFGLFFLLIQIFGQKMCFLGLYGIYLLFILSSYFLIFKRKIIIWKRIVNLIISSLILISSFIITSSKFIIFKNIGKDKIDVIEYTFIGNYAGSHIFQRAKPINIFKIISLKPNETALVRIKRYKYTSGAIRIIKNDKKDTISEIISFSCPTSSGCGLCIVNKNFGTDNCHLGN